MRAPSRTRGPMKRFLVSVLALGACTPATPPERYGFIARLGRDTVSVENVTRDGNTVTSDAVDRFPRVRQRHTEVELGPDGGVRHLVMDIHTPSEPANQRDRHVVVDVTGDSVHIRKRDSTGTLERDFATSGSTVVAHVPQLYGLYELYFAAARRRTTALRGDDTVRMRQFYIDREFDRFSMHNAVVRLLPDGRAEIWHDWLAGVGEAALDSTGRLLRYSGARTTYDVEVTRLAEPVDVRAIGERFAALETQAGSVRQLSVRDTTTAHIGRADFTIDYGRPLVRGRALLGDLVPYDRVWRTGANAATQFTASAPITIAGLHVPAGAYTLWTIPRMNGAELIVNRQTGQWGTQYNPSLDLGRARMTTETLPTPVEQFTISIVPIDARRGTLAIEWGTFRWTAPVAILDTAAAPASGAKGPR
jgi:hypothetical protein